MPFPPAVREEVLVRSRRCCCLCNAWAGLSINVHHIVQEADGGSNDIENAIALCPKCHEEVGHYNARHPLGTKYTPSELRRLRDEWWKYVAENPAIGLPREPISVAPSYIPLGHAAAEERRVNLTITNKSSDPIYGVSLAVVVVGSERHKFEAEWGVLEPRAETRTSFGVIEVTWDMLALEGTARPDGRRVLWFFIHSLRPAIAHSLPLTFKSLGRVPEDEDWFAVPMLSNFTYTQEPILVRPSRTQAGWTEALMKISMGETSYWMGLSASPPQFDGAEDDDGTGS